MQKTKLMAFRLNDLQGELTEKLPENSVPQFPAHAGAVAMHVALEFAKDVRANLRGHPDPANEGHWKSGQRNPREDDHQTRCGNNMAAGTPDLHAQLRTFQDP